MRVPQVFVTPRIIRETSQVLWNVLSEKGFIRVPNTECEWRVIATKFERKWNFPHCVGAIDGKHVVMQAPARSGSSYFNYKKTHSIVLLAVCNAQYEFTLIDVGDAGRQSDGGVCNNSKLGYAIDNDLLNIPQAEPITGCSQRQLFPYTFVADEAFTLKTYMMRPYPRRNELDESEIIYNYRQARARRVIENAFGILASRFRVFRRPIIAQVENVKFVTKAAIAVHNFLIKNQSVSESYAYCPVDFTDYESERGRRAGQWRSDANDIQGLVPIRRNGSNNYSVTAKNVRDDFKDYFNSLKVLSIGKESWYIALKIHLMKYIRNFQLYEQYYKDVVKIQTGFEDHKEALCTQPSLLTVGVNPLT